MNKIKYIYIFSLFVLNLCGQKINKQIIESRLNQYLDFNGSLSKSILVSASEIKLFTDEFDLKKNTPTVSLAFDEIDIFKLLIKNLSQDSVASILRLKKNSKWTAEQRDLFFSKINTRNKQKNTTKKLSGIKIAIDPGHIAGNHEMALIEAKKIKFLKKNYPQLKQDSLFIAEGILTYATAQILKAQLEKEGAEVFLTRGENLSAFGISYNEWLIKKKKKCIDSLFATGEINLSKKQKLMKMNKKDFFFNFFRDIDLTKRAELINQFKPDISVIIHYNVDEKNNNWEKPTSKNYCMAFIPGAFDSKVLETDLGRVNFLRLLIGDDLILSEKISSLTVNAFKNKLNVPIATKNDAAYLRDNCLQASKQGVFSRNLALCRNVQSPLVYGESLYQDNLNEFEILSKMDKNYFGIKTNERVKQVADAYFEGIMNYFRE
jgi:N-acetylmuramoyl-L-alanine amidase